MQAGRLRHRVKIQQRARTQDPSSGESIFEWVDFGTVWASVEPLSAREFVAAQTSKSKVTARVKLRYIVGLDSSMRLLHNGKLYNIEGVLPDPASGREYLTLPVSEGVNDGR